jgi:hypothetical protein
MFYLYQGDVYVTPVGQTVPEFKKVQDDYKEKKLFEVIAYVYFVFTKKDNPYFALPPKERRLQVVGNYELFKGWTKWEDVETKESVKNLIDFYKRIQLSDNDINAELFRTKAEHWRAMIANMSNTAEEELEFAKALDNSTRLAEEFKLKAEIETGEVEAEGVALYLFEIPEDKKPHHLRMKI